MYEDFDFHIMNGGPDEAGLFVGNMFFYIAGTFGANVRKAWLALHPHRGWVKTLVVDSRVMDSLSPPEVVLGERWEFEKFRRKLQRLRRNGNDNLQVRWELLSGLWGSLLQEKRVQGGWVRDAVGQLEKDLKLPKGTVLRLARQARKGLTFVKMGCCISLDKVHLARLDSHFEEDLLQKLSVDKTVCFLDCQRIWHTAEDLLRDTELMGAANRRGMAAKILGWIVWFHEQSHAMRGIDGTPAEEVEAQLETYRMCDEARFKSFGSQGFEGLPTYRQMMKRLARKQPPPYRVVFSKAFEDALRLTR